MRSVARGHGALAAQPQPRDRAERNDADARRHAAKRKAGELFAARSIAHLLALAGHGNRELHEYKVPIAGIDLDPISPSRRLGERPSTLVISRTFANFFVACVEDRNLRVARRCIVGKVRFDFDATTSELGVRTEGMRPN